MGAASSQETGQVAIVELPLHNSIGHPFSRLAFVPLTRRYFPTPASIADLHALYCSDRVRATYRSGEPRLALEEYYASTVVGDVIAQRRAESMLPPTFIPLCIYGEAREGLDQQQWEVLGYLGNLVPAPTFSGSECTLEMFKIYSGARLSADSDVALAIMRASTMLFRIATGGTMVSPVWPSAVHINFNKDDSGVAGALCRLFRYGALHSPAKSEIDFLVSEGTNSAGIPQHSITCNERTGLHIFLQTLSYDQSVRGYTRPSLLRDNDGRQLAQTVGFLPQVAQLDESLVIINIRSLTNDSNFPSPANRDSQVLMSAATRLKVLHDECKARARAPRITDVNSLADRRVADILYEVLGLSVVPDDEVRDLADVIELQILMSMPDAQMHAPVVVKHSLAIQIVHRFVDNPIFADLVAGEIAKPQSPTVTPIGATTAPTALWADAESVLNSSGTTPPPKPPTVAKREVIREACRKCPWRVAATLLVHKRPLGDVVTAALHDAVTAVLHSPPQAHRSGTSGTSSPPTEPLAQPASDRQRLTPDQLVGRLVDLKLRGLVTMPFAKASSLLFALTDVVASTEGMIAAADAFRIIDDAVANTASRAVFD